MKRTIGCWGTLLPCLIIAAIGLVSLTVPTVIRAASLPILTTVLDANGNGTAELAVIYRDPVTGNYELLVKDSLTERKISKAVFGPNYSPVALIRSPDLNGNGVDELWMIGEHDDGRARSRGRDAATGESLGNSVGFALNSNYPTEAVSISSPAFSNLTALDVLGVNQNGEARLSLRQLPLGDSLGKIAFPSSSTSQWWMVALPGERVGVLAVRPNGVPQLVLKLVSNGTLLRKIQFGSTLSPFALLLVEKAAGVNVAVVGIRPSGRIVAEVKHPGNGGAVSTIDFGVREQPTAISLPDMNGNGYGEIAVAYLALGDIWKAKVKDSRTGELLSTVLIGQGFSLADFAGIGDIDGNGIPELVALAVRKSGRTAAFVRDASTGQIISKVVFVSGASVLAAPSNLEGKPQSDKTIDLTWADNALNETGYTVHQCQPLRSSDGSSGPCLAWTEIASLGPNSSSFTVGNVGELVTWRYNVKAVGKDGKTAASNVEEVFTQLAAPTNLRVSSSSASEITIAWDDNSSKESIYKVYRCIPAGVIDCLSSSHYGHIRNLPDNSESYSDTNVTCSVQHRYKVRASVLSTSGSGHISEFSEPVFWTNDCGPSTIEFENLAQYYNIVSLTTNGQENLHCRTNFLPPNWGPVSGEASPGDYEVFARTGFWADNQCYQQGYLSRYVFRLEEGQRVRLEYVDPTLQQVMTQFQSCGRWEGPFNLLDRLEIRFFSNGTYNAYINGALRISGQSYTQTDREVGALYMFLNTAGSAWLLEDFGTLYYDDRNDGSTEGELFYQGSC